ncbi:uncharacterized protein [Littorina saxatilis]|uniref:uncharacterized protein n=1 Tax=Littorina saxatilis TaxID=31220 RepID=UPI0038B4787C
MKILYCSVVLSALCLTATGRPGSGDNPITCKTSGTVLERTAAEVTCDFHSTFDNANATFYVYRQTSNEPVIITICSWNNGDPQCRLVDDFTLKTASADGRVTFEVQSALQKHSGHYICKTLPADEANAVGCTLSVQKNEVFGDNPVSCHTSSPVLLGDQASLFCMFPKTIGMTGVTLEKYCGPEGACKEEIVRCEKDKPCSVQKEGYQVDQKTESHLRVSIPHTTADNAGIYLCRSTAITQESGTCPLLLKPDEKRTQASVLEQITTPVYAILGCFVLLTLVGIVALLQRFSCRRKPNITDAQQGAHSPCNS